VVPVPPSISPFVDVYKPEVEVPVVNEVKSEVKSDVDWENLEIRRDYLQTFMAKLNYKTLDDFYQVKEDEFRKVDTGIFFFFFVFFLKKSWSFE